MEEMPFKCNDIANFNAFHMPSFSNSVGILKRLIIAV